MQEQAKELSAELRELRAANKKLLKAQKDLAAAHSALEARSGSSDSSLRAVEARLASAEAAAAAGQKQLQEVCAGLAMRACPRPFLFLFLLHQPSAQACWRASNSVPSGRRMWRAHTWELVALCSPAGMESSCDAPPVCAACIVSLKGPSQKPASRCPCQAEAKAEETIARLQELLAKSQTSWLPLWAEEKYNQVRSKGLRLTVAGLEPLGVNEALELTSALSGYLIWNTCAHAQGFDALKPHVDTAWEHASKAHVGLRAKLVELFGMLRKRLLAAWTGAAPAAKEALTKAQVRPVLLPKNRDQIQCMPVHKTRPLRRLFVHQTGVVLRSFAA